jgi:hypothetical protein
LETIKQPSTGGRQGNHILSAAKVGDRGVAKLFTTAKWILNIENERQKLL